MEKISVIVPVYQVEKYLEKCIQSIIEQDYKDLEIILVDDGSNDNSGKICDIYKEKDSRIIVVHQKNGGLSNARNQGLSIATGDYIGFVDSDDYIEKDMYSTLIDNIKKSQADVSICGFYQYDSERTIKDSGVEKFSVYDQEEIIERFFRINQTKDYFAVWCCLYSRSVISDLRFTEGIINEDVDFKYRVFLHSKKVCETTKLLYAYNIGNMSITRMAFTPRDLNLFTAWKNVIDYAELNDKKHVEAAEFNYNRVNLTLLLKYSMFGIRGFDNEKEIINQLKKHLRKNLWKFLKSRGLDIKRKVACILCCINRKRLISGQIVIYLFITHNDSK